MLMRGNFFGLGTGIWMVVCKFFVKLLFQVVCRTFFVFWVRGFFWRCLVITGWCGKFIEKRWTFLDFVCVGTQKIIVCSALY